MTLPERVKIVEVGPRDGLQNEKTILPHYVKIDLINRLSESGLSYIEASSFVSPKAIPQLGDAKIVLDEITRKSGVTYAALVPNIKGLENALDMSPTPNPPPLQGGRIKVGGLEEVAIFTAASETFCQKNINASIDESFIRFAPVMELAKAHNIRVRGYVSCVAGCPYEGKINPERVAEISARLMDIGCYEVSLGDTIGVGTPHQIELIIHHVAKFIDMPHIALHMHNTYGQALANIYAGLQMGIATIDSSVGGLGGCPYAKGASGNVATEDLVYMLNGLGIETGVNLESIIKTAWFIAECLGRQPDSKVAHALNPLTVIPAKAGTLT